VREFVKMIIILGGLSWFFIVNPPWYYFFVILLGGVIIPELLFPAKKKTKSRKAATKGKQSAKKTNKGTKKKLTDEEILGADIKDLNGYEFERLVAMYFEERGYKPKIIGGAGDHEVDIILIDPKENYKIAVQCKHWKTKNVGNDIILRLSAGKRVHKCLDAWCITTSNYTKAAKEAAEGLNIKLLNGLHVQDQIVKWQRVKRTKSIER
jgi:restriction system protein